jgi:alpha-L-rhamnosidase
MDLRRLEDIQCLILLTSKKTNLLVPCSLAPEAYSIINKILADILTLVCMLLILLPIPIQAQSLQQSIIWSPSSPAGTQVYRAFRKSFVLATNPSRASLQIFADSRFILWVNGKYVLRGPCRFDWHGPQYDTIDISSFLQPGTNVLAVMVHSYENVTSKIMIHNPGLTAELQLPGTNIFTDTTWRSGPTIYQPSPNAWGSIPDVIDARVQTNDWTATNFNDSAWETATNVVGTQWGTLTTRTIPLAQETVLTNVTLLPSGQNLSTALPITLSSGQSITINLGKMSLAYANISMTASSGSVLQLSYYLRLVNGSPGESYGVGTTYTARSGPQSFITGDEWGCHYVVIQCTSGSIRLNGFTWVDRRYPQTRLGQFSSSDTIFNQIWTNAVNTIELTSDDGYGADARERNEWLQDPAEPNYVTTRISEVGTNFDGTPAYSDPRLIKNLIWHDSFTTNQTGDGRLKAHTCSDRFDVHGYIEDYSCQWIEALRIYYDDTGDTNFVAQMWPALSGQMAWFLARVDPDGLVLAREYTSFDNALAYITCEGATLNAFVYKALNDSAYLGNVIGQTTQATTYSQAATNLAAAFEQNLWNASAGTYNSGILNDQTLGPTTHAALIALDRGIVPTNHLASVRNWFLANYQNPGTFNVASNPNYLNWIQQVVGINMPVTYYWVFNQLYQMDSPAMDLQALNEIRRRWTDMVTNRLDTGTTTECFTDVNGGSESCHNYGSVPAWFLSSYVLGVRLEGTVWTNRILIEPRLGDLNYANGVVVTEHGPVPVSWDQSSNNGQLLMFSFTVPAGVRATVHLPKTSNTNTLILNGTTLVDQGNSNGSVGVTDRWFTLDLPPGTNVGTLTITLPPASIQTQPSGGTGFSGDNFSFSVIALGNGLNYQWQNNSNNIPNATNSILTLTNLALTDAGDYQVVITNPGGVTVSAVATLQVIQPVTNTIYLDHFSGASDALNGRTPDTATIAGDTWIAAGGWTTDGTRANVTSSTINAFLPFTPVSGRLYQLSADINCVGSDSADWISLGFANGTNTSSAWQLVNNPVGWMLARDSGSTSAANQTFLGPGQSGLSDTGVYPTGIMNYAVILDARPNNPNAWTFTFLVNSNVVEPATIFGGNGPAISSVGLGMLSNGGSGYVGNFTLTARGSSAPFILLQPQGGSFVAGATINLAIAAGGTAPFSYQWQKNSKNVANATNATLTITNLSSSDSGNYSVIVNNASGSVASSNAAVTVAASILEVTSTFDSGNVFPSIPVSTNNDLLMFNLASVSPAANGNNVTGIYMRNGTTGAANDGNGGSGSNPANIMNSGTNDFILNTNEAPNGYDITSIVTYSGWMDSRAGQDHSLWYQLVGNTGFTEITNVTVSASAGSLRVTVNDSQGAMVSGVQAIRVVLNQSYFVYREIVVAGTPTAATLPVLQIVLLGSGSVKLWWPASAAGYTLKATPALGVGASWQTVTNTPTLTNGNYQVILPITNTQFLCLQK